ncbi:hypothetical protein TrLO_g889, partial [Triparma laevis f. longispina]
MSSLKPPPPASTSSYKLYSPPPLTTPRNPFASSSSTLHSTNISAYQPSTTSYTPRTTFSLDKNRTMYTNEIKQDSDEDDDQNDEKLMYSTRGRGSERGSRGSEIPLSISAGGSNLGASVLTSLIGDHLNARGGSSGPMVIPSMPPPNTLKKALMSRSLDSRQERMEEDEEMLAALREQFGLDRWREYAVLRHGNSVKFQTSIHGREMIEAEAIRQNSSDMQVLKEKIKHISGETKRLRMKLEEERLLKKAAVVKMAQINGEEYVDEDDFENEENSSVINQNQMISPVTFSSLRRTSTGTSGTTKLHEKLVINTRSGGYGEAWKGATPKSTRRMNLQNFMFNKSGDDKPKHVKDDTGGDKAKAAVEDSNEPNPTHAHALAVKNSKAKTTKTTKTKPTNKPSNKTKQQQQHSTPNSYNSHPSPQVSTPKHPPPTPPPSTPSD